MTESGPRIAVAGAGIAGLTFAVALRRLGLDVAVFEQAHELSEIGAAVALSANSTRLLRDLGVDGALSRASAEPSELQFRRWNSGELIWGHRMGTGTEQGSAHRITGCTARICNARSWSKSRRA